MIDNSAKRYFESVLTVLYRVEDAILVALFSLMIGMTTLQILLRNFFNAGIVWSDVLVRILVLWVGLAGAMVATRGDKHININLAARFFPENVKGIIDGIVKLFAAAVCAIVAYYAMYFVQLEFQDGVMAFGQVPAWVCEAIIPFAFVVMAVRYFMMGLTCFRSFTGSRYNGS